MSDNPTPLAPADARRVSAAMDRISMAHLRTTHLHNALGILNHVQRTPRSAPSLISVDALTAADDEYMAVSDANHDSYAVIGKEGEIPPADLATQVEALADAAEAAMDRLAAIVAEYAPAMALTKPGGRK